MIFDLDETEYPLIMYNQYYLSMKTSSVGSLWHMGFLSKYPSISLILQ